jgi:hypothetical protein
MARRSQTEAVEKTASELVTMEKDGEIIAVCPAQVVHHEKLGWKKK